MYGEDLDWCFRIKQAGWQVRYNPDCTVLHYKRASSRQSRKAQYEFYRAMLLFYNKHYAATTPFWLHWLVVGGVYLAAVPWCCWLDGLRRVRSRRSHEWSWGGAR